MDDFKIYTYKNIMATITNGFTFTVPSSTMGVLTKISSSIGVLSYEPLLSPIFSKNKPRVPTVCLTTFNNSCNKDAIYSHKKLDDVNNKGEKWRGKEPKPHKPKYGRSDHHNRLYAIQPTVDEKFSRVRTKFVVTKFDKKSELKTKMDEIRTLLNKLTEKNYLDVVQFIIIALNKLQETINDENAFEQVGNMIFNIASTNRFYSNTYADLYSELIAYNSMFRTIFMNTFDTFVDLFRDVHCIDSTIDYDMFCENEKQNERRRSLGAFFVNLMKNGIIKESNVLQIMQILSIQVRDFYLLDTKKAEVDELIATLAIMYDKTWMDLCKTSCNYLIEVDNCNMTIVEFVCFLSKCKRAKFPGLTSKSIFKCMDLVDGAKK
jgi:hypothetical protein